MNHKIEWFIGIKNRPDFVFITVGESDIGEKVGVVGDCVVDWVR